MRRERRVESEGERYPGEGYSPVMDRREVARFLKVSPYQVERLCADGVLPYIRLGRKCIRFSRRDCEKLLRTGKFLGKTPLCANAD